MHQLTTHVSFLPWLSLPFPSGPFFPSPPSSLKTHTLIPPPHTTHSTLFHSHSVSVPSPAFSSQLRMKNPVVEMFSEFYEKWVWKLEEILHQLLEVSKQRNEVVVSEEDLQALVSKVTAHLKEYYTVKWASAHEDVLVFFSPQWLSPLENAYLWVTGWKPSTAFRLLESLKKPPTTFGVSMTEEQQRRIEELRMKIRMEEEKVEREMERQQVAMADRKMVELAKLSSRAARNGVATQVDVDGLVEMALKGVFAGLEKVMKAADCVRLKTLKGVLDVLSPMQCVEFLAAHIALQLRLRQWGKKRDMAGPTVNEEDK